MKEFLERAANAGALSFRDLHVILDALPIPLSWATYRKERFSSSTGLLQRRSATPKGLSQTSVTGSIRPIRMSITAGKPVGFGTIFGSRSRMVFRK